MKYLSYLLLCFTLLACNSKPKENTHKSPPAPFDLAKLILNENLPELMAAEAIKSQEKDSTDDTMLGFEIFRANDPKVLRFANVDLSGGKNHVLFHYNENTKELACFELTLDNQQQTDTLISLLNKTGSPIFKQTYLPKNQIELDENGDEVKPENSVRKTYRVWENKVSGISYFLMETGSGKNLITLLIALKRTSAFGKNWIATLQLDWYKNEETE